MTHTRYFLFQIVSFKKYFYVSLGNIFTVLWRPLNCGGVWATAQFAPHPLKSGPECLLFISSCNNCDDFLLLSLGTRVKILGMR